MKIIEELRFPMPGYAVIELHSGKHLFVCCPWYLYAFIKPAFIARNLKYDFYRWLNWKGIMQTEEGQKMCWRDIKWLKKQHEINIGGRYTSRRSFYVLASELDNNHQRLMQGEYIPTR